MRSMGALGLEPKINKQIARLKGAEYHKRHTSSCETQKKDKNESACRICLLAIFTNLQALFCCHQSKLGPAVDI